MACQAAERRHQPSYSTRALWAGWVESRYAALSGRGTITNARTILEHRGFRREGSCQAIEHHRGTLGPVARWLQINSYSLWIHGALLSCSLCPTNGPMMACD